MLFRYDSNLIEICHVKIIFVKGQIQVHFWLNSIIIRFRLDSDTKYIALDADLIHIRFWNNYIQITDWITASHHYQIEDITFPAHQFEKHEFHSPIKREQRVTHLHILASHGSPWACSHGDSGTGRPRLCWRRCPCQPRMALTHTHPRLTHTRSRPVRGIPHDINVVLVHSLPVQHQFCTATQFTSTTM